MKIENNLNYAIISNNINKELLDKFTDYTIIDNMTYSLLVEKIYNFPSKTIIFNNTLYCYSDEEKKEIFSLLQKRNVNYINITSNIEDVIYSDYLLVYYNNQLIMEGKTLNVLQQEKLLKKLGFNLPFTLNLAIQLKYYNVLDELYVDNRKLVDRLWN